MWINLYSNPLLIFLNPLCRFSLLNSDEEDSNANPKDLFGSSKKEKKKSDEVKSSLEQRQERLGRVINRLEEQALTEKPWQLRGEITAGLRPENSLLEETVDFDLSVRPGRTTKFICKASFSKLHFQFNL